MLVPTDPMLTRSMRPSSTYIYIRKKEIDYNGFCTPPLKTGAIQIRIHLYINICSLGVCVYIYIYIHVYVNALCVYVKKKKKW